MPPRSELDHLSEPANREYHGIIVPQGIRNHAVFNELNVLGEKRGKEWTLLKVGIDPNNITRVIGLVQANLSSDKGVPYYAHFYRDNELIVVFPQRVFRVSTDRNSWTEAVRYGESVGIPRAELDFRPCSVQDETF